jgi:type IV secretory pathway TrbD component
MRPNHVALVNGLVAASLMLVLLVLVGFPTGWAMVWAVVVGVMSWLASDTPHPADRL